MPGPKSAPSGEELAAAPHALLDRARSTPAIGRYLGLIADLGTDPWDGSNGLLSARRTRRKTWIFMGAFPDLVAHGNAAQRFMAGFAIVDAGLVATAFAYVFDREKKQLWEDKITVPLGFPPSFQGRLQGTWALEGKDRSFHVSPHEGGQVLEFKRLKQLAEREPFELRIQARQSGPGMSTVAPSPPDRPFNFTYKDCDLELDLALALGAERHAYRTRGMVDFTLGYPPRRTFWNWAAGHGSSGESRIGFNLVAQFNAGLENALWLDGRVIALSAATFRYDPKNLSLPWHVETADGLFQATFEPDGRRAENIQAVVLASRFVQLFGRFQGHVMLDGEQRAFSAYGVVEEHHALW